MSSSSSDDDGDKKDQRQRTKFDLLDHYEQRRYFRPFMIYQAMAWWPVLDVLAEYGHVLHNFIIVWLAINYNVSIYMCFNLCCVCVFYTKAVYRLQKRATESHKLSGLQSQTDLNIASMVTKRYKIGAFYEFLSVRSRLWRLQFQVLVVAACLGFGSTIIFQIRTRYADAEYVQKMAKHQFGGNATAHDHPAFYASYEHVKESLDTLTFWVFVAGIYKDSSKSAENYFYLTFLLLGFGLVCERQAINWLTNRSGCTYNKLQKFIELDLRKQAVSENWPVCPPKYDVDRYAEHYFLHDFDDLKRRFRESEKESGEARKRAKSGGQPSTDGTEGENRKNEYKEGGEIRDFVPYNVAVRIKEVISFSVKLAGRCPDLNIHDDTAAILDKMDKRWEEEREEREKRENLKEGQGRQEQVGLEIEGKAMIGGTGSSTRAQKQAAGQEYEDVKILRDFKIKSLGIILKAGIDRKYKISFFKGV